MQTIDTFSFFLQIHRALLSSVVPELRAVTYDIDLIKRELNMAFIFETEIDDNLFDMASIAFGEIDMESVFNRCIGLPVTVKLPTIVPLKTCTVYCRYEPLLPTFTKAVFPLEMQIKYPEAYLITVLNQALLGRVTPNLRAVSLEIDEPIKSLSIRFVYDREVGSLEKTLAIAAFQEAISLYPDHVADFSMIRVDYPKPWPRHGKRYAYQREEDRSNMSLATPDDVQWIVKSTL